MMSTVNFLEETATMEKRYQEKWSTSMLTDYCWTLVRNSPEQLHKRQEKRSRKWKWTFIVKCVMYIILTYRGKLPNKVRFPNMGRCIISYQEVLCCLLKNVNDEAHEAVLYNLSINGQLLRTSVLTGHLCFGAL